MDARVEHFTEETRPSYLRPAPRGRRVAPYLLTFVVVALALALGLLIKTQLFVANVALVFLAAVVLCAARGGLRPALFACALSVVCLNFFFFPPMHNLAVEDPENVVAVVIFVGTAVFLGRLTARARSDAATAERRATVIEQLYAFARRLTSIDDLDQLLAMTAEKLAGSVAAETVLLLGKSEMLTVRAAVPPTAALEAADLAAAERCVSGHPADSAGLAGDGADVATYLFLPLRAVGETVGVMGLRRDGAPPQFADDERRFIQAIADQVAVATERLSLAADAERARVTAETESLRSAMLSAISHDLKTPLASILGAATSLSSYNSYFEQQAREELVATIREEAERMSCFVANLLDITRLESGTLEVRSEATDIEEVIGATVRRSRRHLGSRRLTLRIASDLPMLRLDCILLEQTLFNLIDNAAKYAPSDSTIEIEARRINDRIVIKVIDAGPGIPPEELSKIFEKFYRSGRVGRRRAGTGLGLAICRGFVEAMGGRIIAGNRTDRSGAIFMIGFPLPRGAEAPRPLVDDD